MDTRYKTKIAKFLDENWDTILKMLDDIDKENSSSKIVLCKKLAMLKLVAYDYENVEILNRLMAFMDLIGDTANEYKMLLMMAKLRNSQVSDSKVKNLIKDIVVILQKFGFSQEESKEIIQLVLSYPNISEDESNKLKSIIYEFCNNS